MKLTETYQLVLVVFKFNAIYVFMFTHVHQTSSPIHSIDTEIKTKRLFVCFNLSSIFFDSFLDDCRGRKRKQMAKEHVKLCFITWIRNISGEKVRFVDWKCVGLLVYVCRRKNNVNWWQTILLSPTPDNFQFVQYIQLTMNIFNWFVLSWNCISSVMITTKMFITLNDALCIAKKTQRTK